MQKVNLKLLTQVFQVTQNECNFTEGTSGSTLFKIFYIIKQGKNGKKRKWTVVEEKKLLNKG
ncbi:MAG: hypothetical protein CM15mV45_290 [uncultured marine virus]|nr:MAG: hypothetical protein CM15mV45_290 [uncultured marine virus]